MGIGLFSAKCDVCNKKIYGKSVGITGKGGFLYVICNGCHDKYKNAVLGKFIDNKVLYPITANEMAEINSNGSNSAAIIEKLTKASLTNEIKLEKNAESIEDYVGGFGSEYSELWKPAVSNILNSMDENEELLHAFRGICIYQTVFMTTRILVDSYVGIISNKRFYYVGKEPFTRNTVKSDYLELRYTHRIDTGEKGRIYEPFVRMEVNSDDYELSTHQNKDLIKKKLEEGIKACKDAENSSTIVQNNISAADELKKFKELLDMGAITQEEFDAKKKQLLGI